MKELSFEEIRQIELDLLIDVANFCDSHGITYFLAYGTLLGAVRHQGFIPWDDDIDIEMPREDYERFLALYNKEKTNDDYLAVSPYEKKARHTFGKVIDMSTLKCEASVRYENNQPLGVDIDIFPLDGLSPDGKERKKLYRKRKIVYQCYLFSIVDSSKGKLKTRIVSWLCGLFGKDFFFKKAQKIKRFDYYQSDLVSEQSNLYVYNKIFKREWFDKTIDLPFEGHMFKVPAGYDQVLTTDYGDYMTLPPESEQVTHHTCKMYKK